MIPANPVPAAVVPASTSVAKSVKLQSIFQIIFDFDESKTVQEQFVQMDEDFKKTIAEFDLNYWDSNRYRNFSNC